MMTFTLRAFKPCLLVLAITALGACGETPPESSTGDTDATAYNLQLDIKGFMNMVMDPVSDVLWDYAGWVDDVNTGYEELYPETDEEWLLVQQKAAQLIEAANALALPGRAVDNDGWITYSNAMATAASLAYAAAQSRSKEDFFQAGAQIYSVCSACHQSYNPEISRFTQQ